MNVADSEDNAEPSVRENTVAMDVTVAREASSVPPSRE